MGLAMPDASKSASRFSGRIHRHWRRLTAILVAPMAVFVSGWIVVRAGRVTSPVRATRLPDGLVTAPVGPSTLVVLGIGVVLLALIGILAVRRDNRGVLWGVNGGVLLLGILPFAGTGLLLLVGGFIAAGAVTAALPRAWYHGWFVLGLLVSLWSLGGLVVGHIPGHVAVMAAVSCAIVFGLAVAVVGISGPRPLPPDTKPIGSVLLAIVARQSGKPLREGIASGASWRRVWVVVAIWSVAATGLHFGGLEAAIYSRYWWYDVFVHAFSGFGVAAISYLLRPGVFTTRRRLLVLLPGLVLVIGAGFEGYEYVFKSFYQGWTPDYYLTDTILDMIANTTGGMLFALLPYAVWGTRSE